MAMSAHSPVPADRLAAQVITRLDRRKWLSIALPLVILGYLVAVAISFDVAGIAGRARMDNARVLMSDFHSHKTHVTRDNRSGDVRVAIEGENKGTYPPGLLPDWVTTSGPVTRIDLGQGHVVTYEDGGTRYDMPGHGTIRITPSAEGVMLHTPDGQIPEWINAAPNRITLTTDRGRVTQTRARTETFRYQPGWPAFFFTPDSAFFGRDWAELAGLAFGGARLDPQRSNLHGMAADFLGNPMWQHGAVFMAMFETMLMAFLGTFGAAIIALPLGFMAACNMMPFAPVRFALRRLFDFIRGVDGLIWTVVLARAFGPGPMTGSLAILLTDTGSFGKTFSEAIENIDNRQVEGIRSTGAGAVLRARFGVLPQVMPVLLSQVLYYLESNTRSATVIGAIVGGGIGLMLTQAIQTQKDWEDVAWYIVLIIVMVMIMDAFSGWLRRKLIKGERA